MADRSRLCWAPGHALHAMHFCFELFRGMRRGANHPCCVPATVTSSPCRERVHVWDSTALCIFKATMGLLSSHCRPCRCMLSLVWCLQSLQDVDNVLSPYFQQEQAAKLGAVPPQEDYYAEPEELVKACVEKVRNVTAVLL